MRSNTESVPIPQTAEPSHSPSTIDEAAAVRIPWLWHFVNFAPFFGLVWFVSRFSVNIPYLEEWRFAYLFRAVRLRQANLALQDLFALNYEHRLFFPKLIWTVLAFATHWNLRVETLANLVFVLITFLVFYRLALRQARQAGDRFFLIANLLSSVLLFSLAQYETWLWGIGGAFLLVQASVALAIGLCFLGKMKPWTRFCCAAFFCTVASFSSAHGLLSWLALIPCIIVSQTGPQRPIKIWTWNLLFAASIALYAYHYEFFVVREAAGQFDFLYHPLRSAGFFLVLLGLPFSLNDAAAFVPFALLMGGSVLGVTVWASAALRGEEWKESATPWLSVALFGLFFAIMVTSGRSAIGLTYANQSRYVTGTGLVAVAAVQLGRLAYGRKGSYVYPVLLGALLSLTILCSLRSLSFAQAWKDDHSRDKLFVELIRYLDPVADGTAWNPVSRLYGGKGAMPMAEILNDLGFLRLASNVAFVEKPCLDCGAFESAEGSGSLLHLRQSKDELTVSGWASLPRDRGLPKVVMISYGEQKTFITGAVVGILNRPDIATVRRDPRYLHAGWRVSFPAKFLPMGEGTLKAWVYDSARKEFIRIPESGRAKQFKVETP